MSLLWVFLAVFLAFATGRSMIIWGFLAYTFGGWALLPIIFLKPKVHVWERRIKTFNEWNDKIEAKAEELKAKDKPEGYQDFNTVDDLFKQLQ